MTEAAVIERDMFREANELARIKAFARAFAVYSELIERLEPTAGPRLMTVMARALKSSSKAGLWPETEALGRRMAALYPDNPDALRYLGEALIQLDRKAEAEAPLMTAIELRPGWSEPRVLLDIAREPDGAATPPPKAWPWPWKSSAFEDLGWLIRRYLLAGYPRDFTVAPGDAFMTLGSCFAVNLGVHLGEAGYRVHAEAIGEEVNSTYANRYLLEWIKDGPVDEVTTTIDATYGPVMRERLRKAVAASDVFVLTLGLAPCFFHRDTGEFVLSLARSSTGRDHLQRVHVMRTTSVAENVENIGRIIDAIRAISPRDPKVVLTVSPVPLAGTTELGSAIIADCLSKSTLRLACHEVVTARAADGVTYWPSFEIVRWLSPHLAADHPPAYGADDGNSRHVSRWLVALIVDLFIKHHRAAKAAPKPD